MVKIGSMGADVICVIECHIMMNDAYDIKIWRKPIWTLLVSKEAFASSDLILGNKIFENVENQKLVGKYLKNEPYVLGICRAYRFGLAS